MADIYNPNNPGNKKPGGQFTAAPGSSTVQGQGIGGNQQQGGGRFANLQNYIKANKDSDTSQRIGANIQNTTQQAGQDLQKQEQGFNQQLNQEQQRLGQFGDLSQKVQNDQINDEDVQKFGQYRKGEYEKPQVDMSVVNQNQQKAQQQQQMTGSETGRFQLLRDMFGRPTYSTGQQRLDQLLLQSGPNQLKNLQRDTGLAVKNTQDQLNTFQNQSAQQQQTLAQQAEDIKNQARNLVSGQTQTLRGSVEGREQEQEGQARDSFNILKQIIEAQKAGGPPQTGSQIQALPQGPQINEDQYNRLVQTLGSNADTQLFGALRNSDPNSFLNEGALDRETSAFANDQDLGRFSNLQKLAGDDADLLGGFNLQKADAYDPSKMFNQDFLNRSSQQKEAEYRSALGDKESRFNGLKTIAGEVGAGAGDERTRQILSNNLSTLLGSPVQGQIDRGVLEQINAYGKGNFGGEDLDEVRNALSRQNAWGGDALSGNREYLQGTNWMTGQGPNLSEGAIAARDSDIQKALAGVTRRRQSMADEAGAEVKKVQDQYGYGESLKSLLGKYRV